MNIKKLILLGAGGHAKVVLDTALLLFPEWEIECRDDDLQKKGGQILSLSIQVPIGKPEGQVHVAIGNNRARMRYGEEALQTGVMFYTLVHPRAVVAQTAHIDAGSFIAAGAILGPDTRIGKGCIINHGAIVDHDSVISDYCHIAPNATLGGGVIVGREVLIGAGATILPKIRIGDGAVIAAGAVVTKAVQAGTTVLGVPASMRKCNA
jgi:sugar O-acyltransferase (sialic acid O-acetyltransferase NeuD family)